MTDAVTCPNCLAELDLPQEFRGKQVRCASCQMVFTTPQPRVEPIPLAPRSSQTFPLERNSPPLRSNGGVWLLMLIATLIFGGGTAAVVLGILNISKPKMHDHVSPEGRFRITFPGDGPAALPKSTRDDGVVVAGTQSTQEAGQQKYVVKFFDLKKPLPEKQIPEFLREVALEEIRQHGSAFKETAREETQHDGHPALDVWLKGGLLDLESVLIRCVKVRDRIYVVSARGGFQPQTAWVQKFFISFTPTLPNE